jgi:hypothetical protein
VGGCRRVETINEDTPRPHRAVDVAMEPADGIAVIALPHCVVRAASRLPLFTRLFLARFSHSAARRPLGLADTPLVIVDTVEAVRLEHATIGLGPSDGQENLRLANLTPASHCRTCATDRPTTP